MKIIKLNAIDSTNSYLIKLNKNEIIEDYTVVVAIHQNKGRGQLGTHWKSVPHESLLFSVFKRFEALSINHISSVSFAVSLGLENALKKMNVPKVAIKWPNDIMSRSKKMAGILIENQIKQAKVSSSVIGIGLNVNEESFEELPKATSMFLNTKNKFNLDKVLDSLLNEIKLQLNRVENDEFQALKNEYESSLFRKDKISFFEDYYGNQFNGMIKGVSNNGEILIEKENSLITTYKLKEIKLLF